MQNNEDYPPISPISTGLKGRCPRCGQGALFSGFLATAPDCNRCGLDFSGADTGDGPMVFIILIVGLIATVVAFWLELTYQPPYWLHAIIALGLVTGLSLSLLRPAKGLMLTLQYHHGAREGKLVK